MWELVVKFPTDTTLNETEENQVFLTFEVTL